MIKVFTDGACRRNPGPGGWGVRIECDGAVEEYCGAEEATTNNKMEMQAVIEALQRTPAGATIYVVTDSKYVMQGIQEWIAKWKDNGWRTASREPVKNQEQWRTLDELITVRTVHWEWVKGHSGHAGNERADQLANRAIDEMLGA